MAHVTEFKKMIVNLEDEKLNLLNVHGARAAQKLWEPIDAKLAILYAWAANEVLKGIS